MKEFFYILGFATCVANFLFNGTEEYRGGESEERLILKKNGEFLLLSPSYEDFNDSLSYGKWAKNSDMLTLTTSEKLMKDLFETEVVESNSGSPDSIYVYIQNPEVGLTDVDQRFYPYVFYNLQGLRYNGHGFESELFSKKLVLPRNSNIFEFNICIFPNLTVYPLKISTNYLRTYKFKPNDIKCNTYHITIKHFNPRYFSYRRFKKSI